MAGFQERWIVGKTVKAVHVERFVNEYFGPRVRGTALSEIEFGDGSRLVLSACHTEYETLVGVAYYPPPKRGK